MDLELNPWGLVEGDKDQMSLLCCPVGSALFLFFGQGSPLNSTNERRMPFFSLGHWASEGLFLFLLMILHLTLVGSKGN